MSSIIKSLGDLGEILTASTLPRRVWFVFFPNNPNLRYPPFSRNNTGLWYFSSRVWFLLKEIRGEHGTTGEHCSPRSARERRSSDFTRLHFKLRTSRTHHTCQQGDFSHWRKKQPTASFPVVFYLAATQFLSWLGSVYLYVLYLLNKLQQLPRKK